MRTGSLQRPTWAEIDLDSLAFNLRSARQFIGSDIACMAVVKADAYGHGAPACAARLKQEGVEWLAVATLEEGGELRDSGVDGPILVLGGTWPRQEDTFLDLELTPTVFRVDQAVSFNEAAAARAVTASIHIKIDTGMGRVGFRPDEIEGVLNALAGLDHINVEGLMTHFAVADDLGESDFTRGQIAAFDTIVGQFRERGHDPKYLDIANSPGAVAHPGSRSNLVRLGGILYGLGGDVLPAGVDKPELRPVMSVRTRIAQIKRHLQGETIGYGRTFTAERNSRIALIPIGYHDGYRRSLSNRANVLVHGQIARVVGRVSMDWTAIDITDVPEAEIGDTVTVIGADGGHSITAEDLAGTVGTISYEITCGISRRVPRILIGELKEQ